ncbi:Aminomethyltransferase [Platysternon megacephalum]|uniref:Chordin n=1 Tax=Platysternon megacephalum TaxID=55544 RepID=A0A4D9DPD9_9SAUR|nr:Aminomethyltransferase [Platysternon megacephalum]
MAAVPLLLAGLLPLALCPAPGGASRPKPLLPIQPEKDPLPSKGAAGCSFGGRFYALEDTWHPDLGEPFGVMHCVVCYCEPQRNRRGKPTGKVSCKNIKHDCPTLPCSESVLLPGHCCKTCPKASPSIPEKRPEPIFDSFEYFQDKEDDLHKSYNDRSYLSSEDLARDDSRTDFVALLTSGAEPWLPLSSAVAKARFTLVRSYLLFSINYERSVPPRRWDKQGNSQPEASASSCPSPQICGMWRNLHKPSIRLLKAEQLRISLVTKSQPAGEIQGPIIKHRALFAETFSAILTSVDPTHMGTGGIAMLTLSDTENNLHFILMAKGLLEPADKEFPWVSLRVRILHQSRVLREVRANITMQDPDFAEVLSDLSSREMLWLAQGQLKITAETEGRRRRQIAGYVTARKSCDTLQSVLCGGDALMPTKTGAVGSAKLALHENGTLEYQIQVAGTASEVISVTLETKPRRKNKRNILFDMTPSYREGLASGTWQHMNARDTHMLLQSELFLNVATKDFEEGEVRGQISSLLYSGLLARYTELPIPLAGQLVSPPVRTSSAGHAWVSLDEHCHLHYEIVVGGLGKSDDVAISAHLHGVAELGERGHEHARLLKGFYGTEAQGVVKDLDAELLRHLAQGTAFLQVSTKVNPRGEMRGKVGATDSPPRTFRSLGSSCGSRQALPKADSARIGHSLPQSRGATSPPLWGHGPPSTAGRKRTVICDPILCQPLNCTQQVHLEDRCCPVCEERKASQEELRAEKARDSSEGCYFDGDKTWRGAGTRWHPVVPPFGLIKCAICTCKGATGEVHCEKVQCPRLTCSNPVRVSPSDCCKQCPAPEKSPPELSDMMQADGPRACRFGRQWYMNNESWHPTVPPFGEMKCITCWCVSGETHCQRQECSPASCSSYAKKETRCCARCRAPDVAPEEAQEKLRADAPEAWSR